MPSPSHNSWRAACLPPLLLQKQAWQGCMQYLQSRQGNPRVLLDIGEQRPGATQGCSQAPQVACLRAPRVPQLPHSAATPVTLIRAPGGMFSWKFSPGFQRPRLPSLHVGQQCADSCTSTPTCRTLRQGKDEASRWAWCTPPSSA